jgi:hypothetical protein
VQLIWAESVSKDQSPPLQGPRNRVCKSRRAIAWGLTPQRSPGRDSCVAILFEVLRRQPSIR